MKGQLVRHKKQAAWGPGVVISDGGGYVVILFEGEGTKRKFKADTLDRFLVLDVDDVPSDSPLRVEARWEELVVLPPDFDAGAEAKDARVCEVCDLRLRDAQHSADETWKSCPSCSRADGRHHVFYRTPDAFGTTPRRQSATNPIGVQSYCIACRQDVARTAGEPRKLCNEVAK